MNIIYIKDASLKLVLLIVVLFLFGWTAMSQVVFESEVKITDFGLHFDGTQKTSGTTNTTENSPYDYYFGNQISAHGDCITSYNQYVFMTWYKGGKGVRNVMLTRLNTTTGTMATIEFPHRHTGYQNQWWIGESHNTIAVGISPLDGTIHLLYDMHAYSASRPSNGSLSNDYFRYSYSIANAAALPDADFTLDKFVQSGNGDYKHLRMPGSAPQSEFVGLTYPKFFLNDAGELFMNMREGGNNNGAYKYCKYNADTGTWSNFINFNTLNAKNQPGITYNWGLYGNFKYVNGKIRIGFQRRSSNNSDKYQYQNGVYYAYSDNQDGNGGWKNHQGQSFSLPLYDADFIKVMEPGDYVQGTNTNSISIVSGFDWTVTDKGDVHIISRVRDNQFNVTKYLHTYKPAGATDFITTEAFSGAEEIYTAGNDVFIIGLTGGRVFVEKAEGGTNNFTRVYQATGGRTFSHGQVYIANGKLYYYLMENASGNARPLYLQTIDLDIVTKDPTASNNFTIQAVGETCANKNNGKLIINGEASHDYTTTINGVEYNFNEDTIIEDLTPGTYEFCIEVVGKNFSHCYEVTIESGVNLTGKIQVSKKTASISVNSGTAPYSVIKNGTELFQTYQTNFSVAINHGDEIMVKSKEACQGLMSKTINLLEDIKAYPNPSDGIFELYIPTGIETIDFEVYNIHSQLITINTNKVNDGKVRIDIADKPKGIYFVKLNSEKPVFIKLIKK
ncbi:BNR-4 repeat-containing protein [Litoribaculum gwangyangense]|uniref:Secretion system C-terminal sorting domain-containing protein n=1 Tax=Litoribaculum gwangyangense TaxID=1130722 RepID=A0ABP9CUR8_9FLAO